MKVWDTKQTRGTPCSRNISHFKTGRAEVGVLSECGALWTVEVTGQQSQLWVT